MKMTHFYIHFRSNCPFNPVSVCVCVLHMNMCPLSHRLDTVVGPSPRPFRSRVKTFSSPSLHLYYSQARRKQSAPGLDSPHPDLLPNCLPVNITKLCCHTRVNQGAFCMFLHLSESSLHPYTWIDRTSWKEKRFLFILCHFCFSLLLCLTHLVSFLCALYS